MLDKDLYQQILGIGAPWHVADVDLDASSQEVRIRVDHPRGTKFQCPDCMTELPCHDHGEERRVGGYRNIQNFITAIFFYCGGLSLHPR
jgi:hypothetical protein